MTVGSVIIFVDGSSNFYDGKYVLTGFWPRVVDFDSGTDDWFDLEEGQDVGFEDISLISEGFGVPAKANLWTRNFVDWWIGNSF